MTNRRRGILASVGYGRPDRQCEVGQPIGPSSSRVGRTTAMQSTGRRTLRKRVAMVDFTRYNKSVARMSSDGQRESVQKVRCPGAHPTWLGPSFVELIMDKLSGPLPPLPKAAGVVFRVIPWAYGYCVGTDGSVWSCRKRLSIRSFWKKRHTCDRGKWGHQVVTLPVGMAKRHRAFSVHRLILEMFVGPSSPGQECRHIDGNPRNNQLSNLQWGTHRENYLDSIRHGTVFHGFGENHRGSKLSDAEVMVIMGLKGARSGPSVASEFGVNHTTIYRIWNGKRYLSTGELLCPTSPQ